MNKRTFGKIPWPRGIDDMQKDMLSIENVSKMLNELNRLDDECIRLREENEQMARMLAEPSDMRVALDRCIYAIEAAQKMYGTGDLDIAALSYAREAIAKAKGGE